jgi:hypothetical protein
LTFISLSAIAVAIMPPLCNSERLIETGEILDTLQDVCYSKFLTNSMKTKENIMTKNSKLFDIIVLAGMVVNIILAVFLILYYFDFL